MRPGALASLAAILIGLGIASASARALHGINFPGVVGGFSFSDATNLERTDPGQGHRLDYSLPGWSLDVFV